MPVRVGKSCPTCGVFKVFRDKTDECCFAKTRITCQRFVEPDDAGPDFDVFKSCPKCGVFKVFRGKIGELCFAKTGIARQRFV